MSKVKRRYKARDLAALPEDELWAMEDGQIEVEFDPLPDGSPSVLTTTARLTIFSAMMWRLYVDYPRTPARIEHHIRDDRYTNKTHLVLLNRVHWDCVDAYDGEVDIEELCLIAYRSYNAWYNRVVSTARVEREVSTISIEDLIDVVEEPRIAAAIQAIDDSNGSPQAIANADRVAEEVLRDHSVLVGNPIRASVNSKPGSLTQIKQCLIARGQQTDLDSQFFPEAIPSSFLSGMNSLIESMMESCTAKKAAAFKEKPIEDAEYFNRRLQLLAATVQEVEYVCRDVEAENLQLHPGDCGTRRTVRWFVKPKDLRALAGKYYQDADGLHLVHESDRSLIGKTIQMRSVIHCAYGKSHPQTVCAVCYGDIANSLPRGTNLGQVAAVDYGEKVTQAMLSVKHVDVATATLEIILGPWEKEYMQPVPGMRQIRFLPKLNDYEVMISVAPGEANNLSELQFEKDVTTIPVSRISELSEIYLTLTGKQDEGGTIPLRVETGGKKAHFSHAMLDHIRQVGYTLSDTGRYVIKMKGFDYNQPAFDVPNKDENILDYLNSIVQFISSSADGAKKHAAEGSRKMLRFARSVEEAIATFLEISSAKLNVNIVHLEVIIYATMIRSLEHRDYRLPHDGNVLQFGQLAHLIGSRSLSAAMAFEKNSALLLDPATYINPYRVDHPLDDLLVPRNAVK